ncbi:uncharacterized protein TNCV_3500821 [Trichonephila clavipes]|nr:uncharacterized protein TNCV_3500821 [Trichonephila clavipes]
MCQHKCMLDTTSKFLNCSAILTLYPHNLRICDFDEIMKNRHVLVADGTECITNCKDDCAKTKYIQVVKERFISELNYHTHLEEECANYRKPPDGADST